VPSLINLDFADVRTVMSSRGLAHMGIGVGSGESRMLDAAKQAISSPMLETSIEGARAVLINITGGADISIIDINEAAQLITAAADPEANIIFGAGIDESLGEEVRITVIATGFEKNVAPVAAPVQRAASMFETAAESVREAAAEPVRRERARDIQEEDDEPISPIFERRAQQRRERAEEPVDELEFPDRPVRKQRAYADDYQESRTQARRGFQPDVPSFLRRKDK